MSYKTDLQSNNTDLQSILDMILALGLVDASTATLITFTIYGIEYQAEDGMTWAEWCESDYNTGGFYINDSYMCFSDGANISMSGYGLVEPTMSIIAGQAYVRFNSSSGSDD